MKLQAPAVLGDRPFLHWEVVSSESSSKDKKAEIDVKLDSNTLAWCRYQGDHETSFALLEHFGGKSPEEIERIVGSSGARGAAAADLHTDQECARCALGARRLDLKRSQAAASRFS